MFGARFWVAQRFTAAISVLLFWCWLWPLRATAARTQSFSANRKAAVKE
jgi:hypothetical protein